MKLTKKQQAMLNELGEVPDAWAACEGRHLRRTANALQRAGLIEIDALAPNWFDCRLTDAGRLALQGAEHDQ